MFHQYKRTCPSCDVELTYSNKANLKRAADKCCRSCTSKQFHSALSDDDRLKRNLNIGKAKLGVSIFPNGRVFSKTHRKNMRISAVKRICRQGHFPSYNPHACKLIDNYGEKHGYIFQHAENGGEFHIKELGYWVDGYDVEQNVVIEVDELYHTHQKERDAQRQKEIVEHLNCKFIRIKA